MEGREANREALVCVCRGGYVREHSRMFSRHVEHGAKSVGVVIAVKGLPIQPWKFENDTGDGYVPHHAPS